MYLLLALLMSLLLATAPCLTQAQTGGRRGHRHHRPRCLGGPRHREQHQGRAAAPPPRRCTLPARPPACPCFRLMARPAFTTTAARRPPRPGNCWAPAPPLRWATTWATTRSSTPPAQRARIAAIARAHWRWRAPRASPGLLPWWAIPPSAARWGWARRRLPGSWPAPHRRKNTVFTSQPAATYRRTAPAPVLSG